MPRIASFDLLAVDLPLRSPFRHAAATRSESESLFLRCATDSGEVGWGECLPRSYVTGETRDGDFELLQHRVLPRLLDRGFDSIEGVEEFLAACDGKAPADWVEPETRQTAAWCAVDLALLDAFGRAFGASALGSTSSPFPAAVRYSGVASADRGVKLLRKALLMRAFGLRSIKLKVERSTSDAAIRALRRAFGRATRLRVDGNMAWSADEAVGAMRAMSRHGIRMFEQPVAADDLDGMSRLVRETGLGVMADESLNDRESLRRLLATSACTAVNVRVSKCGGLVAARRRCREALEGGLVVQVGCQVGESSLLSAAHLALVNAVGEVTYAEGCFGTFAIREDPVRPGLRFGYGGRPPRRPPGPGLGVCVDDATLDRFTSRRAHLGEPS